MSEESTRSGADPEETDDGHSVFVSAAARREAALRTVAALSLVGAMLIALRVAAPQVTEPTWIRSRIDSLGTFAPIAFATLQTVQVVIAPIPGQTLAGVGGYLFGTLLGTVYSMFGVLVGSSVVFLATRRFGRPYVERILDPGALAKWDEFVAKAGVPGLFVLFLLPTFPDDLLCFVAGLTDLRFGTFLALVLIGRTPTFVAAAYAGTQLANGTLSGFAVVLITLTLLSVAVYAVRNRILASVPSNSG
jgi:uncharacterized membrane protein YdjX (TVP38/TMEM64 family)